jgi:hypothetical protein
MARFNDEGKNAVGSALIGDVHISPILLLIEHRSYLVRKKFFRNQFIVFSVMH